jgi:hypothetical protein
MQMAVFFAGLIYKKLRSCFFRAYQANKMNCVPVSASVCAEATQRQVRLRTTSYDETRQLMMLRGGLNGNHSHPITEVVVIVNIDFLIWVGKNDRFPDTARLQLPAGSATFSA